MEKVVLKPKTYEGMSVYRPPLCYELAGKTFELVMDDGFDCELKFLDKKTLTFGLLDGEKKEYQYDCLKSESLTYFVNFEEPDVKPRTGRTFVLDVENWLVTEVKVQLGCNPKYDRMPTLTYIFGAIRQADGTVSEIRHGYTSEMVGRAVDWNYGTFDIVHVYSSERYFRVAFSPKRLAELRAANPNAPRREPPKHVYEDQGTYIKIKDGLYLVNLLEAILCRQNGHGNSLLFLMNLNTMHDVGRSFGTNGDWQDENYVFGAFGEPFDASEQLAKKSTWYIR